MLDRYPHEFSGGMRQRAVIAMALSCDPKLIIADEPTTALDVIVQDQILKELKKIQEQTGNVADLHLPRHRRHRRGHRHDRGHVCRQAGRVRDNRSRCSSVPGTHTRISCCSSTPSITGPRRKLAPLEGEPPNLLDPPRDAASILVVPSQSEKCVAEEPPLRTWAGATRSPAGTWERVPVTIGATRMSAATSQGRQSSPSCSRSAAGSFASRSISSMRSMASASRSGRANPWAWWGSRDVGSRPPAGC